MIKFSKQLQDFADDSKGSDGFWVERAKLAFAISLEKRRRAASMTYAAVAKKIGTSAAYVTKVFRGDTNVTIETMVKLARATGGELEINVVEPAEQVRWETRAINAHQRHVAAGSTITDPTPEAANHCEYRWRGAA